MNILQPNSKELYVSKETLLEKLKACIRPGSTIYSDEWKSYAEIPAHLEGYDFEHYTVNHSEIFVHPITGAHTVIH